MSLPELLRHQHLFVGSLTIRRVRRLRPGDQIGGISVDAHDCTVFSELAATLLHRDGQRPHPGFDYLLATQGFDYPSLSCCPALGEDRRCAVHHAGKPDTCSVVPLEALVPDRLQHLVLARRISPGENVGSDCIVAGERAGHAAVTARGAVVDARLRQALARRRAALGADKRWWGDAVFRMLQKELLAGPNAASRIPFDGFLSIAPAPVLMVLADVSARCRRRCIEYLDAQIPLVEGKIRQAIVRNEPADVPVTRQMEAFLRTSRALRRALHELPAESASLAACAAEVEVWLGLDLPLKPQALPGTARLDVSHALQ